MPFRCHILCRCGVSLWDSSPAGREWTQLLAEALTLGVTQPRRDQRPPTRCFESHASRFFVFWNALREDSQSRELLGKFCHRGFSQALREPRAPIPAMRAAPRAPCSLPGCLVWGLPGSRQRAQLATSSGHLLFSWAVHCDPRQPGLSTLTLSRLQPVAQKWPWGPQAGVEGEEGCACSDAEGLLAAALPKWTEQPSASGRESRPQCSSLLGQCHPAHQF